MENASKALLMAAGVLIGILILSLGVYLFVSFSQHASQTYDQIKEDQINQFNSEFVALQGKNITIYDVISTVKRAEEFNGANGLNSTDDSFIEIIVKTKNNNNYDNTSNDSNINSLAGDKMEKWIKDDKEEMDNVKLKNADGTYTDDVKLPPYKCTVEKYNDQQRVKRVKFEYDEETWNEWKNPT